MQYEKEENNINQASEEIISKKQHLLTDEKFNLIKECQEKIYTATESKPSIRKIINELITEENLQPIKSKFISIWKM